MRPLLAAGLVCLAIAAVFASWWFMREPPLAIQRVWFYDLNTAELFPVSSDKRPPVPAPSGDLQGAPPGTPAGVQAMVVMADEKPKVLLLMTTDDEHQPGVRLVKRPGDANWESEASPAGQRISQEALVESTRAPLSFPE
jgi:hypothetical protein